MCLGVNTLENYKATDLTRIDLFTVIPRGECIHENFGGIWLRNESVSNKFTLESIIQKVTIKHI